VYLPRVIEKTICDTAKHFPALLLVGARQVGKTTVLRQLAGNERAYVTLDDPRILDTARSDPALFMRRHPPPVLLDEIQYAPEILPFIKMAIDADRKPGMFWLTGSQQFHVMRGVSESLAGRVGILNLLGLSQREGRGEGTEQKPFLPDAAAFLRKAGSGGEPEPPHSHLFRRIWRGAFPAMTLDPGMNWETFFRSYVQTYLQRDVRALTAVGDEAAFFRFMRAAAARTGQLLNTAILARDADVAPNTAKKWLSILETSGVVCLLEPYHANVIKRMVKAPKLYFLDTGLAAYLTEWTSPEVLEAGAMSGAMLETWMFGEILKSWVHNGLTPSFYYYRDRDQKEIDLVIVRDGCVYPVEFKKTASPDRGMAANFALLEKTGLRVGDGAVVALTETALPLSATAWGIPAGWI
jgi:predicted AAA+ superfamily ATPase